MISNTLMQEGRIMEMVKEEMIAEVTERLKEASPEEVYMVLTYLHRIMRG